MGYGKEANTEDADQRSIGCEKDANARHHLRVRARKPADC